MHNKILVIITVLITCHTQLFANDLILEKIPSADADLHQALWHLPARNKKPKPVILILHGATFPTKLASGFKIKQQSWIDTLANSGYRVYALDFLGYGASDRYPNMLSEQTSNTARGNSDEVLRDIAQAVKYIFNKEKINTLSLIAHSRGGLIALLYAQRHTKQIKHLILLSPVLPRTIETNSQITNPKLAYIDINVDERVKQFSQAAPLNTDTLEEHVKQHWAQQWLASDPTSANRNNRTVRIPLGYLADIKQAWNNEIDLKTSSITQPVLIMRGKWDHVPTLNEAERFIKSLTSSPQKKLITIPQSTHVALLEKNRHLVYKHTLEFLKLD